MPRVTLVSFFQVLSILGTTLTVVKLYRSGLHKRYRIFFRFLVFLIPYMTTLLLLDYRSNAYFVVFFSAEWLIMLFYILVVLELYRLVLERYRGLYTLGKWAMYAAIVISAAVSVVSLLPKITPAMPQRSKYFGYLLATERGVDLGLLIFIMLILLFLSRYPITLSRNVAVYAVIYSIFFLSNTVGLLFRYLFGKAVIDSVNTTLMGISSACAVAWWLLLSPKGEEAKIHAPAVGPEHEQRILQQLDALNATLLRVARK